MFRTGSESEVSWIKICHEAVHLLTLTDGCSLCFVYMLAIFHHDREGKTRGKSTSYISRRCWVISSVKVSHPMIILVLYELSNKINLFLSSAMSIFFFLIFWYNELRKKIKGVTKRKLGIKFTAELHPQRSSAYLLLCPFLSLILPFLTPVTWSDSISQASCS